jgi:catechol 2,3-dioxygenase-like lactoylglutathione lyase family enzyme
MRVLDHDVNFIVVAVAEVVEVEALGAPTGELETGLERKGARMSRPDRVAARSLTLLSLTLLLQIPIASAAVSWATLDTPPTGTAPPGDILRAGHLGREIGETQNIIHFYTDLIGLGLVGPREAPRPFMVSHPLAEFAELGEDANAYDSVSRVALLPIPGTAATATGTLMTIEAMVPGSAVVMEFIEYKDHNKHFTRGYIQDPGTAHFLFMAKDDDVIMPRVRAANLHTLSRSNVPVFIGPTTRSFFVPDPQGFWLEFMDHDVKKDPAAK